jgi:Transcription termination factor nusG
MSYWAAAQLEPQRDGLALHGLEQAGFQTYCPRVRERRTLHDRKVVQTPLLFPGYLFVLIELQWHTARWSPGVVRLVLNGGDARGRPGRRHCGPQGLRGGRFNRIAKAVTV